MSPSSPPPSSPPGVEPTMRCPECGGVAHLLTPLPPDEVPRPGDVLSYRCEDCGERWDVEFEDQE